MSLLSTFLDTDNSDDTAMTADEHLILVQQLLEDFGRDPNSDSVLLHLHALFGPSLVAALQLVDDRDVVRVRLPGGRVIYQVSSSTGAPYTIYLDLPSSSNGKPAPQPDDKPGKNIETAQDTEAAAVLRATPSTEATFTQHASKLGQMFCPCPGFAYQSLLTDKAEMCKHLLAVLLAFYAGKFVDTDVGVPAVVGLLNLAPVQ